MSGDLRRALHSAYTLVRSVESNKAISSWTLDHMIQDQITRLKQGEVRAFLDGAGETVGSRTSRYDQLTDIETQVTNAVKAIKDTAGDPDKLRALGVFEVDMTGDGTGSS